MFSPETHFSRFSESLGANSTFQSLRWHTEICIRNRFVFLFLTNDWESVEWKIVLKKCSNHSFLISAKRAPHSIKWPRRVAWPVDGGCRQTMTYAVIGCWGQAPPTSFSFLPWPPPRLPFENLGASSQSRATRRQRRMYLCYSRWKSSRNATIVPPRRCCVLLFYVVPCELVWIDVKKRGKNYLNFPLRNQLGSRTERAVGVEFFFFPFKFSASFCLFKCWETCRNLKFGKKNVDVQPRIIGQCCGRFDAGAICSR